MSAVSQAQQLVDQLRHQVSIERVKVSEASQSLVRYVSENESSDPLLTPSEHNPFKDKRGCFIL